ncbi:MAG: phosphatidate cytidylyltransferase [Rhodospirillaceae bacterium]|nr:phosphatidate cytidylyltransferase [Rhodospirillaceae bacterium]
MVQLRFLEKARCELGLRVLSSIVLATITVALVLLGGWWFAGLVLILALIVVHEWFAMSGCAGRWAAMAAIVGVWFAMAVHGSLYLALYMAVFGAIGTAMFSLVSRGGEGGPWAAAGTIYAALPMAALLWMRAEEGSQWLLLWMFLVVWSSDTGAYIVGRLVGGMKLAPKISPGKTVSGAVGGLTLASIVAMTLASMIPSDEIRGLILGAVVAITAQAGDLLQSAIKRRYGVKDSGSIIPGHGGVMDRLDSLVLAAPALAVAVVIVSTLMGAPHG